VLRPLQQLSRAQLRVLGRHMSSFLSIFQFDWISQSVAVAVAVARRPQVLWSRFVYFWTGRYLYRESKRRLPSCFFSAEEQEETVEEVRCRHRRGRRGRRCRRPSHGR
jgi:hypothetical protein